MKAVFQGMFKSFAEDRLERYFSDSDKTIFNTEVIATISIYFSQIFASCFFLFLRPRKRKKG